MELNKQTEQVALLIVKPISQWDSDYIRSVTSYSLILECAKYEKYYDPIHFDIIHRYHLYGSLTRRQRQVLEDFLLSLIEQCLTE